jgi:hypothetical protein
LSLEELARLVPKLREIEEQATFALSEIPRGLTHSRVNHILILARFMRMKLEGRDVAPVEALPETLRNKNKLPRKEE